MVGDENKLSRRPSVGLALGGGTARGVAHVGALKVLERYGLRPQAIAGTSAGAIIAAMYALGATATSIEHSIRQQNLLELWSQALDFGLHKAGLVHGRRFERWLDRKIFYGATFGETEIPLAIVATDVRSGELINLREGRIARAVMASCALPGVLALVPWQGRVLMDGGGAGTVPFGALDEMQVDLKIGLHAGLQIEGTRFQQRMIDLYRSRLGQMLYRGALKSARRHPWADLGRGLVRLLAAYESPPVTPEGAVLVRMNPPVSWWGLHRSPEAVRAGEQAMQAALLDAGSLEPLILLPTS